MSIPIATLLDDAWIPAMAEAFGTGATFDLSGVAAHAAVSGVGAVVDPAYGAPLDGLPCQVLDPDLWFADSPADLEIAKSHCAGCPFRIGCLAGALDRREPWGVWGGEILEQGAIVARKRPRGRPRKSAAEAAA